MDGGAWWATVHGVERPSGVPRGPATMPSALFFPLVLNKGQCVTKYYRWMQKNGGYIWIQSSATIAINAKNANEKKLRGGGPLGEQQPHLSEDIKGM